MQAGAGIVTKEDSEGAESHSGAGIWITLFQLSMVVIIGPEFQT